MFQSEFEKRYSNEIEVCKKIRKNLVKDIFQKPRDIRKECLDYE